MDYNVVKSLYDFRYWEGEKTMTDSVVLDRKEGSRKILKYAAYRLSSLSLLVIFMTNTKVALGSAVCRFNGFDVIFGNGELLNFSFMNLLTYFLILSGFALQAFDLLTGYFSRMKLGNKVEFNYITAAVTGIGAILQFFVKAFTSSDGGSSYLSVGAGVIIGGIFGLLSAVLIVLDLLDAKGIISLSGFVNAGSKEKAD